jgi:hypothetical protein
MSESSNQVKMGFTLHSLLSPLLFFFVPLSSSFFDPKSRGGLDPPSPPCRSALPAALIVKFETTKFWIRVYRVYNMIVDIYNVLVESS